MPREGSAAAQCCGYRKVKGPGNTEAVFALAALCGYPEHLKRFRVCEVGCAFSMEEELWMAGPSVAKPNPLDRGTQGITTAMQEIQLPPTSQLKLHLRPH